MFSQPLLSFKAQAINDLLETHLKTSILCSVNLISFKAQAIHDLLETHLKTSILCSVNLLYPSKHWLTFFCCQWPSAKSLLTFSIQITHLTNIFQGYQFWLLFCRALFCFLLGIIHIEHSRVILGIAWENYEQLPFA